VEEALASTVRASSMSELDVPPLCNRPLMQIDHYGEVLVRCIDCNRWGHPGDDKLVMEVLPDDLEALRPKRGEPYFAALPLMNRNEFCCLDVDLMKIGNIPTRPQRGLSLHEHH
jgi:hypothetical protein